jgi:branched-chain amino acid transport system ATP-binding protein
MLFLHGVTLTFGGLSVIQDLDFKVAAGSRCGLIGPNGAGKTTIFNLISGVYRPTSGEILLDDKVINDVPLPRRVHLGIGRTFQNLRLMKHLTVLENVMLGQHRFVSAARRMLLPLRSRWNEAFVAEARQTIDAVGLKAEANRLAEGLSYGMQKRVELARALVTRPRLLLLDEPAAGLHSAERGDLVSILRSSIGPEMAVLVVEHDVSFIGSLCDHVVALNFGRKIAEGRSEDVCSHPAVIEAYLGRDEEDDEDEDNVPSGVIPKGLEVARSPNAA